MMNKAVKDKYKVSPVFYLIAPLLIAWGAMLIVLLSRAEVLLFSYAEMGRYALYMLVFSLAVLMINQYRMLSFPTLFVILTWAFHFGLFVAYFFDATDLITFDYLKEYYTVAECRNGYLICSVFYCFLTMGVLTSKRSESVNTQQTRVEIKQGFISICLVTFVLCLFPYYFFILRNVSSGSYDSFSLPGFMGYINYILYATSIVLFYTQSRKRNKVNCLLIAGLFFPSVLTGARAEVMCLYLVFVLLYFRDMKLKVTSIFAFFLVSVIALYVIHVIGLYRNDLQNMISFMFNWDHFLNYLKKNPILSLAGEFGSTVISVIGIERNFDSSSFFYGKTYVAGFTTLIPKLNSFVPLQYLAYTLAIPRKYYHSLGGSLFGEAYVNFGWFGCVLIFGLGRIIRMMYKYENKSYRNNDTVFIYIQVIYCFLFLVVRAYIKNIYFMGFWCGLSVYLYNQNLRTQKKACSYLVKDAENPHKGSKYIR